jgi:hypothetical protein
MDIRSNESAINWVDAIDVKGSYNVEYQIIIHKT